MVSSYRGLEKQWLTNNNDLQTTMTLHTTMAIKQWVIVVPWMDIKQKWTNLGRQKWNILVIGWEVDGDHE